MIWLIGAILYVLSIAFVIHAYRTAPERDEERDLLEPYRKMLEFDLAAREREWKR